MIIDSLENAERYLSVHPLFEQAFEYLKAKDLTLLEDGKFDIADGIKGILSTKTGKTEAEALEKFECHNKYIDIQLCISGTETVAWKPRAKCEAVKTAYNEEKDVVFYDETPDTFFKLTDKQFVIFFPEDAHAAMIGNDLIKKLVLKIKI